MNYAKRLCLVVAVITGLTVNTIAQSTAGSLPVVLVGFSANLTTDNSVNISWTTQQEINTDYFTIEKSNDGNNWGTICSVKATGNSSIPVTYNSIDKFPLKGSNFYRLSIRSLNGLVGYTIVKQVRVDASRHIIVYPNPSTDFVNISLGLIPPEDWNITVINNTGQVIAQKKINRKLTTINMPVVAYPNGNYILRISYTNFEESKQLIVSHN